MFSAVLDMFASSSRPRKRQRTEQHVPVAEEDPIGTPTRITRSARKNESRGPSADTSASKIIATLRNVSTQNKSASGSETKSKGGFVDSAYQSMGASPNKEEDNDNAQEQLSTPAKRKTRAQAVKDGAVADKEIMDASRIAPLRDQSKEQRDALASVNDIEHVDVEEEAEASGIRLSGRTRLKTWKVTEPNGKDKSSRLKRKDGENGKQSKAQSIAVDVLPDASDTDLSTIPKSSSKLLKMPRKRDAKTIQYESGDMVPEDESDVQPTPSKTTGSAKKSRVAKPDRPSSGDLLSPSLDIVEPARNETPARRNTDLARASLTKLLGEERYADVMLAVKSQIMNHLTGRGALPICGEGHFQAYQKIHQILEQTVTAGEGNSILLIGARSTAKSVIVDTALRELGSEHKDQFHTIRLNGFLHTDDRLALREIWRQLGREMAVEDEFMSDRTNYADTLTSLLALLSQPEELPMLEHNRTTSKSVVFILDEFDLFTTHPRQTLLYNLFDIAQSRKAPIAVLGLTTRIDVVESLEKRVKSRFSHRYVHVSHPRNLSAYISIIRAYMLASFSENDSDFIKSPTLEELAGKYAAEFPRFHRNWSAYVESLLADPSVQLLLHRCYSQTKSPQAFLNAFLLPMSRLPTLPIATDLLKNDLAAPDSNLHLLQSLSEASLALLVSAARLDIICDTDTVTFNMAYDEYVRLAQRSRLTASASGMIAVSGSASGGSSGLIGRDVALAAWERLEDIGLLLPMAGQGGQSQGASIDLGRGGRLVRVDVGLEEIGSTLGSELGPLWKWCKEI